METLIGRLLETLGRNSAEAGVLVLVVLLAQWIFRKKLAPRWRCTLWLLVMLRLLLPVSVASVASVFNLFPDWHNTPPTVTYHPSTPTTPANFSATTTQITHDPLPETSSHNPPYSYPSHSSSPAETITTPAAAPRKISVPSVPSVLFFIWVTGVLLFATYVLASSLRLRHRFAKLAPLTDPALLALLGDCRQRLGVHSTLTLAESPDIATPALYGFLKPILLLPRGFTGRFSAKELRFILLHELAHVKRRDILFNWLAAGLQILHWFNPLIWLGFARWRADRELACDALALEAAGEQQNREYGQTILRLLENFTHRATVPGLVGILEDKKQLQWRIRMIATFRPGRKFGLVSAVLFAVIGAVCLTDAQDKTSTTAKPAASSATHTTVAETVPARPVITNGPAMTITVLDDITGKPLDQAEILAPSETSFFGGRENSPRWLTGPDGTATIRLGEAPTNSLWQMTWFTFSARKPGYAPVGTSWSAGGKDIRPTLPQAVTVRLKPGVTVGGTVVDETGAPQPGVQVRVFGYGYDYGPYPQPHQTYAEFWNDSTRTALPVTDAAGHWQVKDFPADLPTVAIQFIRSDESVESFRYPAVAENLNEPQGTPFDIKPLLAGNARFVLKSGDDLHGLVVDPQGQPLAGVRIKTGYGLINLVRAGEVHSDASGHFVLHHLNHRQAILTADDARHAVTSLVVDLPPNQPEIRLPMTALSPLHIHVVDGDGHAVAGARVETMTYGTEAQLLDFSSGTDARGNLVWTNAPVSDFRLVASSTNSYLQQSLRVTPETREVTFRLRAGMDRNIIIDGTVRDAKTGAPVKLDSVRYQTGDLDQFRSAAQVQDSGFHLDLPVSRFHPGTYPNYQLQLKAAGYATLTTDWHDFVEGDWNPALVMQPAEVAGGTVSLPDGTPAAGARIWAGNHQTGDILFINRPDNYYGDRLVKAQADANGKFILPDAPDDQPVVFTALDGFLSTTIAAVKQNPAVRLEPWGRVTGIVRIAGQPAAGVSVSLWVLQWSPDMGFNLGYTATTATDGSFVFEKVPAGEYKLCRYFMHNGRSGTEDHPMPLVVKAGETTDVKYENAGRAVTGQAISDRPDLVVDWQNDDDTLTLQQPPLKADSIDERDYATQKAFRAAYNTSYQSPGRLEQARQARSYVLGFESDGSFRAEDIPPGTYEMKIQVSKPDPQNQPQDFTHPPILLGSVTREVVVPAGDGPFDLGTFTVPIQSGLKKTPPVNFTAQNVDGHPVTLAQYKGKYVLLAFWATWSERSTEQLADVQKLQTQLNHDNRIVFLGSCLDGDATKVRQTAADRGYQWTQTYLNSTDLARAADAFDVSTVPSICLINPDGRLIASGLEGDRLSSAVQRVLAQK